jgi:biopolymer transport protein ExbD
MGGAAPVDSGGKGKKKSLDSELNLVPFIDLLSCLISFLLITAVWTQISSVQARSTGSLSENNPPPEENPNKTSVRVLLTEKGYTLTVANQPTDLPKAASETKGSTTPGRFDTKTLSDKLKEVQARYSEQKAVTVAAEDTVQFEDLIGTIDAVAALKLDEISVTPAN